MVALFGGVALTNTAMVGAATAGTLIAGETAAPWLSGAPNAANVLGTAIGTIWLALHMARRGRRSGLVLGYGIGVGGAVVAVSAVQAGSLLWLIAGMVLMGIGNGGAQLSRYAAADLYPPERKSFALGVVVWSGTIGAFAGPALISVTAHTAGGLGLERMTGPFLLVLLTSVLAGGITALLVGAHRPATTAVAEAPPVRTLLRLPVTLVALTAMIASQVAMVAVMTMTPLEMHQHGHGLGEVGAILTVHLVGMFAFAPVSGRLADRFGGARVALAGLVTLVVAAVSAFLAPDVAGFVSYTALFLLGYGWNLAFVGSSSLLSSGMPEAARTRLQGVVDALAWTASGLASIGAGVLMAGGGYATLAVVTAIGLVVTVVVVATMVRRAALR